jgi:hypothetical protein
VEVEWEKERIAQRQAHGEVPLDVVISAAAGSPHPVPIGSNLSAAVAREKTQVYVFKAKQARKSIFALELKVIERKGWTGTCTDLGCGPAVEQGHQLAGNDDDDDDEVERCGPGAS